MELKSKTKMSHSMLDDLLSLDKLKYGGIPRPPKILSIGIIPGTAQPRSPY